MIIMKSYKILQSSKLYGVKKKTFATCRDNNFLNFYKIFLFVIVFKGAYEIIASKLIFALAYDNLGARPTSSCKHSMRSKQGPYIGYVGNVNQTRNAIANDNCIDTKQDKKGLRVFCVERKKRGILCKETKIY